MKTSRAEGRPNSKAPGEFPSYEPWSKRRDRETLAKRWGVTPDEVTPTIERLSYTPYLPLSDADILEISKALETDDSTRAWNKAVAVSRKRANRRCRDELLWVVPARSDFFNAPAPPFPKNLRGAREWVAKRFGDAISESALPGDDGLTLPEEDFLTPDWDTSQGGQPQQSPRALAEGSWERLLGWARLLSSSAAVTPAQALSYILTSDVSGAEPPIRVIVIEKVGRSPVVQMAVDPYVPSDLVQRAYSVLARMTTGKKRARPGPKEMTARAWPSRFQLDSPQERAHELLSWMESIAKEVTGPVSLTLAPTIYHAPAVRYVVRPYAARPNRCREHSRP